MKRRTFIGLLAGALAARSALSTAQAGKPARIGLLLLSRFPGLTDPFIGALRERGWVLGKNLEIDTRLTAQDQMRAADMAREMIAQGANLIAVTGTANAMAARQASTRVPIVMIASGYPVEVGLASSLAKPGGNVTGMSVYAGTALFGKFVALLKEAVPKLARLGIFWGYAPPAFAQIETDIAIGEMTRAAGALGIQTRWWMNPDLAALDRTLAEAEGAPLDALFVSAGGAQSVPDGIAKVAAFCERLRLPAMSDVAANFFAAGAVLSYSVDFRELGVRSAGQVDKILRGAKPGDLPIEQPTRFELVLNLKRARQIGMAIPPALLARADRVIE
jgi:putative ABC transport system substrate-binding protein